MSVQYTLHPGKTHSLHGGWSDRTYSHDAGKLHHSANSFHRQNVPCHSIQMLARHCPDAFKGYGRIKSLAYIVKRLQIFGAQRIASSQLHSPLPLSSEGLLSQGMLQVIVVVMTKILLMVS
jgi:hypothetical protein